MKRYLHEKIAFVQGSRRGDEHVLIVPGAQNAFESNERSRIYSIRSPLVSRTTQYRILLDLRRVDEIIERERPDVIETSDPYQLGWQALRSGRARKIPIVAFYHSHFAEAYLRRPAERFGAVVSRTIMNLARHYTRNLYSRFDATLVASRGIATILRELGLTNVHEVGLGVNTEVFHPADDQPATRDSLGIPANCFLLLYVGRLVAEKNTQTLLEAFALLAARDPRFHLLVVGDGEQGAKVEDLRVATGRVTWIPYAADPARLAEIFRAADLFVHPGVEETFGLVAIEAQACGTPVVGIRGTHMDEAIMHEQTLWADENSAEALADAVERMSSQADLRALGTGASEEVRARYEWSRVFERLFSIYDEVLAR